MGESGTGTHTVALLRTKLHRPRVGDDLVPRPRLLARLNQGLDRPLTLVCASAGYGKTTLLAQWLAKDSRPTAWLSLDENDNDLVVFLTYLVAAVQTIYPDSCPETSALLQVPQTPPQEYLTTILVNEVAELPEPMVLILDDYHKIQDQAIQQLVQNVIGSRLATLHLVLAARVEPLLALAQLRVSRQMTEIRAEDLRFTPDEARAFLESAFGKGLSDGAISLLEQRTEGWIAGLRLAALSIRGEADAEALVRRFKGTHRNLADYLVAEVLAHQSPATQEFLLRTSILDRFCAQLCDALLNRGPQHETVDSGRVHAIEGEPSSVILRPSSRSQVLLEELEQANLFLVPLDDERGWYRYHHLFQELLRHMLHVGSSEEEIDSLHRRASAWYAGQGYDEEALGHALAAGDVLGAVRLVESRRVDLFNREDWHTLERWLKRLPEETVRTRPALLIAQAQVLLARFNLPAAVPLLAEAEACLEQDESLPEDERLVLQAEMAALVSSTLYFSGDVEGTLATTERALQHLPPSHSFWRGLALDFHCLALQATGKMEIAVRMMNETLSDEATPVSHRNQAFIGLCFIYLAAGNLRQMRQTAELFREFGVKSGHLPAVVNSNYFAGLAHYEWNELEETAPRFSEVFASRHHAYFISVYFSTLGLIKTYLGLGNVGASQAAIDNVRAYALETGNTQYLPEIDFLQWRHFILQDDIASASQISPCVPTGTPPTPLMFYEDVHLKQAEFRLIHGDEAELSDTVAHLEQQLEEADQRHGTLRSIQILAHLALAYQKMGQVNKALEYLEQSVVRGQAGGFIRTFVDLGPEMARLLRQSAERGVAPDHVRRILAAFPETPATPEAIRAIRQDGYAELVEPLTERELEVLKLLGQRLSDQEIARTLSISVYTAKTHARNIYQKLGVSGRRQAVAKARSFGILL